MTKRNVSSVVARLFDALGIVNAIAVSARIIFQNQCKMTRLDWDEELTGEVRKQWKAWDQEPSTRGKCLCLNVC